MAKKLTYGMVGGGPGSFIGDAHRRSINLDGNATLVAGCFSRTLEKTLETGKELGIAADRCYVNYEEMAKAEAAREDGIDFVVVVTPNYAHYGACKAFLEAGIHVSCDKPLAVNVEQAEELEKIAKEKGNALALLNFPPMKDFVELAKTNPKLQSNGKFDINKIFNKNAHIYSLPSEINGASYCAFFTQVILSDGTLKSVVPSAALVSNKFMDKWSSRQPYYIVAGSTHGRLTWDDSSNRNNWGSLVGPDYNFGREDLDALEPYGVNVITYVPRKGTYINSNQTAKQSPVSALSKIHVRELAIFLQNEIANMLENYHWELNTQTLRDTIKAKADSILETVKNNGGVYDYINICDETNNSNVVVDNEMLVLDTHIEPARGAGKMIHNLTIYRTGEMKSSVQ